MYDLSLTFHLCVSGIHGLRLLLKGALQSPTSSLGKNSRCRAGGAEPVWAGTSRPHLDAHSADRSAWNISCHPELPWTPLGSHPEDTAGLCRPPAAWPQRPEEGEWEVASLGAQARSAREPSDEMPVSVRSGPTLRFL